MLISSSVPNLAGGVSQQPDSQRSINQCEAQENALPLLVGGLIKRPPSNHVSEVGSNLDLTSAFTHVVTRDETEEFIVTATGVSNSILVHDLAGTAKTVYADLGSSTYLTGNVNNFRAVSIADVTFLVNTSVKAQMNATALSPPSNTKGSNGEELKEALVWVKQSIPGAKMNVTLKSNESTGQASNELVTQYIHTPEIIDIDDDQTDEVFAFSPAPPSTFSIAELLGTGAVTSAAGAQGGAITGSHLGATADFDAEVKGNVIHVYYRGSDSDFQITSEDGAGGAAIQIVKDEIQNFADLPPIAPNGMIVKVAGNPESDIDDYFVKFTTNGGESMGEGIWSETIESSIVFKWNYDTLPHILIRQSDGSFMVKRADGTTPGSNVPTGGDYSEFKFNDRTVGSDLTNPLPSFSGKTINDISFFRNRLVLLSGENVILSEFGEFFNFFRITVTQLLDSTTIDIGAGGTEINEMKQATPFSDRLVVFSDNAQFALRGEGLLSPATASLTQITNFDVSTNSPPVFAGRSLFFAFNRGRFSGIREFYKTNETDIQFDAVEVTAAAPKYIEGIVDKMTVSMQEDLLAVLARTRNNSGVAQPTDTLYMYKFFSAGPQRIQSAWFKFTFENSTIIDCEFVEQSLFLLLKRGNKTFIERVDLQNGLVDDGASYVTCVDRRVKITAANDSNTSASILPMPAGYSIVSGDTPQVVSADGEVMTIAASTSNTITLAEGFQPGDVFYVGNPYTMRYEFTKPILKRRIGENRYEPIISGRHQIRYMMVSYDDSAAFTVRVTQIVGGDETAPVDYPFTGRFISAGGLLGSVPSETGTFRVPIFSKSDAVKIEILNDGPLPSNIQSAEFEANYESRSQRM